MTRKNMLRHEQIVIAFISIERYGIENQLLKLADWYLFNGLPFRVYYCYGVLLTKNLSILFKVFCAERSLHPANIIGTTSANRIVASFSVEIVLGNRFGVILLTQQNQALSQFYFDD